MASLRAMISGDIEAVLKLAAETPEAPHWDRAAYERIISSVGEDSTPRAAWVAVNGPDLLGFAVAQIVAGVCELEFIVVTSAARRKGIGRSLLETVIDWSLASGAHKLQLEVRAGNNSALAFYQQAGFLREGLRRRYYRDPEEDAVLMGKRLYSDD